MLLVYALTSPGRGRIKATGIAGEPLREVRVNGIGAVTGEITRAARPTEANLRRHGRVIDALARSRPALLPARFGTRVEDLDELSAILRTRRQSFRRALTLVRNRVQMTIRMVSDKTQTRVPQSAVTQTPVAQTLSGLRSSRSGAEFLRRRAAEARYAPGFEPIRHAVRRWVRDERVERHGMVTTVYHLIPRSAVEAYTTALERAAAAARIRLVASGPWAPYAFASF